MFQWLQEINYRDGKYNSKLVWYNLSCLTATSVVLWTCYRDLMEDYAFIWLFSIYLITVGGFEVILKAMSMIIDFKNGKPTSTVTSTVTSTEVK